MFYEIALYTFSFVKLYIDLWWSTCWYTYQKYWSTIKFSLSFPRIIFISNSHTATQSIYLIIHGRTKFTRPSFILHFLLHVLQNLYNAWSVTQQKAPKHARIITQGRHHNNLLIFIVCLVFLPSPLINAVSILHNLIG